MFGPKEAPVPPEVSIAIWFEEGTASAIEPSSAEIGFTGPHLIADALTPGASFIVREGPRTVAEGWVIARGRHS